MKKVFLFLIVFGFSCSLFRISPRFQDALKEFFKKRGEASQNHRRTLLKSFPDLPKTSPRGSKIVAEVPKRPERRPRHAQERLRDAPKAPKSRQKAPKTSTKFSKISCKRVPDPIYTCIFRFFFLGAQFARNFEVFSMIFQVSSL